MWEVLAWLLLNYLILNIILWLIGQFGRWWPNEYRYIRWACIRGAISAAMIFTLATLQYWLYDIPALLTLDTIHRFGISLALAGSILLITFLHFRSIPLLLSLAIISISVFGGYYLWWYEWIIIGLLISASLEEYIKATKISYLYEHIPSDIIIWWLCCGLCFAWTENMIYIIMKMFEVTSSTTLILQRSITALPLHSILTGLIWYILIKNNTSVYTKSVTIVSIISVHLGYNYATQFLPILIIPSILLIYILWARLLEKVDRIYISKN